MTGQEARNHALALWRLSDEARREAQQLRIRADQLDAEASRLSSVAAEIADGRSISEALA